jgi:hypothetical protein
MRATSIPGDGEQSRVLSQTPGRVRIHLPCWDGDASVLERHLRQVHGVESVQANRLTSNVLIRFDPRLTGLPRLLAALPCLRDSESASADSDPGASASPWVRVGVRGLVGHAIVDTLWFGAGFLGHRLGLPLAGLGPLHLLLDILVWGSAFASVAPESAASSPSMEQNSSGRAAVARWEHAR